MNEWDHGLWGKYQVLVILVLLTYLWSYNDKYYEDK